MEEWKNITGFPNHYINIKGEVLSYELSSKGKYLKGCVDRRGYVRFKLGHKGYVKTKKGHRLVAEAFIENPENLPQVNHIDGDKTNNGVENLEWCDNAENMKHAVDSNLIKNKLEKHVHAKLKNKDILAIREMYKEGNSQTDISKIFGVDPSSISKIVNNKSWKFTIKGVNT